MSVQVSPIKGSSRIFREPFSESDVLYLHNLFLTPGKHTIHVDNINQGRLIIRNLLDSLQYYQKVACLSLQDAPLPNGVVDILATLVAEDYLVNTDQLTLFFLDHFYYDFVWIEETNDLIESVWYKQFERHILNFKLDSIVPIIKVQIK